MFDDVLALDLRQAAKALGVSVRTVWTLASQGRIPCVRIGGVGRGRLMFPRKALEEWLLQQTAQQALQRAEAEAE